MIRFLVASLLAGCIPLDSGPSDGGAGPPPSTDADLQYCVEQTNHYRAMVGLPPLAQSGELESYAAVGAQYDGTRHHAHAHFIADADAGNLVAFAENEIPWWPADEPVRDIITRGLELMWDEGPPPRGQDNHYANMTGPYTEYGCGVFIGGGEVTVTMDFR